VTIAEKASRAECGVRERIAFVAKVPIESVTLTVSGMAAIYSALRLVVQ